jgi:hypothetical protein
MYAFAILAWEILAREVPFAKIDSDLVHAVKVHRGLRPDITHLSPPTPSLVVEMIQLCWDKERKSRLTAIECEARLRHCYEVLCSADFDIFLSHSWRDKPFLCHVYHLLTRQGCRVWYDQADMGLDLTESMIRGVENSKVVLVCLNQFYQVVSPSISFPYS